MRIIKALTLDKYGDTERYTAVEGSVYKDLTGGAGGRMGITQSPVYCMTLYCELEEGEDMQYPLEDILDKYYVNCTEEFEEKEEDGKHIFIFEVEGDSLKDIMTIAGLVGKRVYNRENGDFIELVVE